MREKQNITSVQCRSSANNKNISVSFLLLLCFHCLAIWVSLCNVANGPRLMRSQKSQVATLCRKAMSLDAFRVIVCLHCIQSTVMMLIKFISVFKKKYKTRYLQKAQMTRKLPRVPVIPTIRMTVPIVQWAWSGTSTVGKAP